MVEPSLEDGFPGCGDSRIRSRARKTTTTTASRLPLGMTATGGGRTRPGRILGPQASLGRSPALFPEDPELRFRKGILLPDDLREWQERQRLPLQERFRHYYWDYRGNGVPGWRTNSTGTARA